MASTIQYSGKGARAKDAAAINKIAAEGQTIAGTISGLESARDQCYIASNATTEELGRLKNNLLNATTTTQVAYAEKLSAKGVKAELSADSQSFLAHHCKEIAVADVVKVSCDGIVSKKCDVILNAMNEPTDYACSWGNHNLEGSLSPNLLGFFNNVCTELGYGFVCKLPIYQMEAGVMNEACNESSCQWELPL